VGTEWHGAWWTPDARDLRVPGSLTRVEHGGRLSLIGTLMVDTGGWDGLHLVPSHTIWGSCHGVPYTLLQCFLEDVVQGPDPNVTHSASDQWTMRWRVGRLVRGVEITEQTRFSVAEFEITGLSAWWPTNPHRQSVRVRRQVAPWMALSHQRDRRATVFGHGPEGRPPTSCPVRKCGATI
jgi:hypothetical protein